MGRKEHICKHRCWAFVDESNSCLFDKTQFPYGCLNFMDI